MSDNSFRTKFIKLFKGKTSLKKRILPALLSAFALSFTLFLFGPLDLTYISRTYIRCTILDLAPFCCLFWLITFAALFIPAAVIGGKIHSFLVSAYCGLTLGFYIQGNYLNIDLGVLDGDTVSWQNYGDNALLNYAVWFVILLIPFLFHYFSRKAWKNFVMLASLAVIVMQGSSLAVKMAGQYKTDHSGSGGGKSYVLSMADQYVFSPNENVVVFLMDATSYNEIGSALRAYPDMLEPFRDFTCFDNMNTRYLGTFPALTYLLTDTNYEFDTEGYMDFFDHSWHSETSEAFYGGLQEKNWKVNLYVDTRHAAFTADNMAGKIANVVEEGDRDFTINRTAFRKLIKLSLYRFLPLGMKAPFRIYSGDLYSLKKTDENLMSWSSLKSVKRFWKNGVKTAGDENLYTVYHFKGAHMPYKLSADGRQKTGSTRQEDQIAGYFHIFAEIMQYMKDLKIYDSSTIIISSDHGAFQGSEFNPQSIFYIKRAGERGTEMKTSHAMISQENFLPTIAEAAGLDHEKFGKSVFDIPEDEEMERCMYWRAKDQSFPNTDMRFNVMREYCYTGTAETLIGMISSRDYRTLPLFDTFY